jgi:cytochrome subunit of sulfide dehydrogenase
MFACLRRLIGRAAIASLSVVAGLSSTATAHAADSALTPHLARNLAATCANCHGTNGHAVAGAGNVALAGRDKAALIAAMGQYKRGERAATIMHQIAKGYTDEQIELIASYFAAQRK